MTVFITINKKHFLPGITVEEHVQNCVIVSACLGIIDSAMRRHNVFSKGNIYHSETRLHDVLTQNIYNEVYFRLRAFEDCLTNKNENTQVENDSNSSMLTNGALKRRCNYAARNVCYLLMVCLYVISMKLY
jgi:hypothetical protein